MRLAVYSDYPYRRVDGDVSAEQAFAVFLVGLRPNVERLVLVGRLDPAPERFPYRIPHDVDFAELPHYSSLADPLAAMRGAAAALRRFWRVLDGVDCVWLLGPHPLSLVFALLARLRGRRFALGVRQDMPSYVLNRRPGKRLLHAAARALEWAYRSLGRRSSVVAVGEELAHNYASARRLLTAYVSLVHERDIAEPLDRDYGGELRVLSVGRLDAEKNPLLLADVLARLRAGGDRWHLIVVGDGPLATPLRDRLAELGLLDAAELRGYVPIGDGLEALYRDSHALLHVSWTEGMPQVLLEAFAAGLPAVATDVGGVRAVADGAALLVGPGDPAGPAESLQRLAADPELRRRLVDAGLKRVRAHTLERECKRVADFLAGA